MFLCLTLASLCVTQLAAQDDADVNFASSRPSWGESAESVEALQQRMRGLQNKAHDISEEVENLDRQHNATVRVVRSLDQQVDDAQW